MSSFLIFGTVEEKERAWGKGGGKSPIGKSMEFRVRDTVRPVSVPA